MQAEAQIVVYVDVEGKPVPKVLSTSRGRASEVVPALPVRGDTWVHREEVGDEVHFTSYEVVARVFQSPKEAQGMRIDVVVRPCPMQRLLGLHDPVAERGSKG